MSKTNHPRAFGTHRAQHDDRENRKSGYSGRLDSAYTALNRRNAVVSIHEGLASIAAPIDTDERWTERECMSEWEALDEWSVVTGDERMADWEIALLTGVEQDEAMSIAWSSVTSEPPSGDFAAADPGCDLYDEDDEDFYPDSTWLMGTVDECFPDGGYIVEGPAPRPSASASGYVRVYDLARELGITSRSLVTLLRNIGEYVASHSSHVAIPTADAIRPIAGHLVACYGERPITADDRLSALRNRLSA